MATKLELNVQEYVKCYIDIMAHDKSDFQEMENHFIRFARARELLNTPSKFYKFRTCKNVNFQTLEKNCIWMPSAYHFVDDSDCNISLGYNFRAMEIDYLKTSSGYLFCIEMFENCLKSIHCNFTSHDLQTMRKVVEKESVEININNHRKILSGILTQDKETLFFDSIEYAYNTYLSRAKKYPSNELHVLSEGRKIVHVFSMTTIMNNKLLWENYAANYTGFCIEYTIPKEKFYFDDQIAQILPVIYKRKIPNIEISCFDPQIVEDTNKKCFMDLYGSKVAMQMLYKHSDYAYEHEWRMIGTDLESPMQFFPYVSKIIVGKDIKPKNYRRVRKIADKLNVPIYRQVFNHQRNKLQYVADQSDNG